MRVHRLLSRTASEGPGIRACLWVQGCSLHCPGCFNPHTWDTRGGVEVSVEDVLTVVTAAEGVEGLTLLGGEPFEQAPELARLGSEVQARGLSVMTFTGYTVDELRRHDRPGWAELLAVTDLLVDGRYDAARPDRSRPWVGSTNQRFHFLTDRYRELEPALAGLPDRLEVRLRPDGSVFVNGQADPERLGALLSAATLRPQPPRLVRQASWVADRSADSGPARGGRA